MYQIEVKRWLIEHRFNPTQGWCVHVDIDSMERANGGSHAADKAPRALQAELAMVEAGATIGAHPELGRVDIVAQHPTLGTYVVEVEGQSSKQREQAIYSALGQILLQMRGQTAQFMLAVPDEASWERQLRKVPVHVREVLSLSCVLVSSNGLREG